MNDIVGYVVMNKEGAMCLFEYEAGVKVLCHGNYATLFPTRMAANRAIERTRAYVERHGLTAWETGYKVFRCCK